MIFKKKKKPEASNINYITHKAPRMTEWLKIAVKKATENKEVSFGKAYVLPNKEKKRGLSLANHM